MNMDVVRDLFPELHETHLAFYTACQPVLREKLDTLLEHLVEAGFVIKTTIEEQLHDIEDVGKSLISELRVALFDPASGVTLNAVAYVDSDVADELTFALDTMMGLGVYRVDTLEGQPTPEVRSLASAGAVAYSAKFHQEPAKKAFIELAELNVEPLVHTAQSFLTP